LSRAVEELSGIGDELRENSRGLHPPNLSKRGIESAFKTLARRSAIPVNLHMHVRRQLPEEIQVGLYYVVSKH
jgi:signal transduction histidine kinase